MPNANFISQTVVAGWRVYSLDGNNGLLAFYINPPANLMILQSALAQTRLNLWRGNSAAVLQGTPSLDSPAWTDLTAPGLTNSVQPVAGQSHFYRLVLRR